MLEALAVMLSLYTEKEETQSLEMIEEESNVAMTKNSVPEPEETQQQRPVSVITVKLWGA